MHAEFDVYAEDIPKYISKEMTFKNKEGALDNAEKSLKKIKEIIKESLGTDVSLISKVDPSIIGGYILKIGSVMLDGSVKSKLQGLRVSMKGIK